MALFYLNSSRQPGIRNALCEVTPAVMRCQQCGHLLPGWRCFVLTSFQQVSDFRRCHISADDRFQQITDFSYDNQQIIFDHNIPSYRILFPGQVLFQVCVLRIFLQTDSHSCFYNDDSLRLVYRIRIRLSYRQHYACLRLDVYTKLI